MEAHGVLAAIPVVVAILILLPLVGAGVIHRRFWGSSILRDWICRLNGFELVEDQQALVQKGLTNCGESCALMAIEQLAMRRPAGDSRMLAGMSGSSMLDLKRFLLSKGLSAEGRKFGTLDEMRAQMSGGACAIVSFPAAYLMSPRNALLLPFYAAAFCASLGRIKRFRHWVLVNRAEEQGAFVVKDSFLGAFRVRQDRFRELWNGTALVVSSQAAGG